ncbi:hypothetical protein [Niabella drilacis]|uniref:Uncharacterized protein n=1 Tax=Niabella drilacis (strain DSM 25811 / CCM 8410 / CCUG 62505 / LMG 26954 / E90) TaxID=1285928 RepID=A0A1G7C2J4_NIADE|nr:hypothetical protein [Niabella drilacis]SDE33584.1 hypothetical protein SAMN04487894_13711 [Niabella drilacis]
MENNSTRKKNEPRVQIRPREGKRKYELRIGSSLHTISVTEQADIYLEVTLCCSPAHADGIVYTVCFSRPRFGIDATYNKEQWVYTKIFDIHRNLVFRADKWGKIKDVLNREEVLAAWEKTRQDLSDSAFGKDAGLLQKIAIFGAQLRTDLAAVYRNDLFFQWLCNDLYGTYEGAGAPRTTGKRVAGLIGAADIAIQEEKQVLFAEDAKTMIEVCGTLAPRKINIKRLNHDLFLQVGATGSGNLHFSYAGHYLFTDRSGFFDQAALSVSAVIDGIYNRRMIYALNTIL